MGRRRGFRRSGRRRGRGGKGDWRVSCATFIILACLAPLIAGIILLFPTNHQIAYRCQLIDIYNTTGCYYTCGDYCSGYDGVSWTYVYNSTIKDPSDDYTPCDTMTKTFVCKKPGKYDGPPKNHHIGEVRNCWSKDTSEYSTSCEPGFVSPKKQKQDDKSTAMILIFVGIGIFIFFIWFIWRVCCRGNKNKNKMDITGFSNTTNPNAIVNVGHNVIPSSSVQVNGQQAQVYNPYSVPNQYGYQQPQMYMQQPIQQPIQQPMQQQINYQQQQYNNNNNVQMQPMQQPMPQYNPNNNNFSDFNPMGLNNGQNNNRNYYNNNISTNEGLNNKPNNNNYNNNLSTNEGNNEMVTNEGKN